MMKTSGFDSKRLGRCYELAGKFSMDNPQAILVHGSIEGMGMPRLKHAFCVTKEGVWEPITNEVWPLQSFISFFSPHIDYTYGQKQAMGAMVLSGHFGPWEGPGSTLGKRRKKSN
jgi:hypothetical protein